MLRRAFRFHTWSRIVTRLASTVVIAVIDEKADPGHSPSRIEEKARIVITEGGTRRSTKLSQG